MSGITQRLPEYSGKAHRIPVLIFLNSLQPSPMFSLKPDTVGFRNGNLIGKHCYNLPSVLQIRNHFLKMPCPQFI